MDWRDEGILIAARRHGESAAIVEIFTAAHGRHAGVVRGGGSRRMAPVLQPGATLGVEWSARLEEHIGHFRVDPIGTPIAALIGNGAALATLGAVAALIAAALPERAAHPALYAASRDLVAALGREPDWPARYARWELALLTELGFGLDLSACAVTGARTGLAFVSPRTGRAVTREAAGDWAGRLLPLPGFLCGEGAAGPGEVAAALALTGHFLETRLAPTLPREALPSARARAVAAILRAAT
ncbi:DNA repair protein RecO [Amaricoccus sp.]|uniref:DNA repair protein RecO n=1 Tax=Amaricoccus sp. TaxID=1872485 RepID=UPI001B4B0FD8|nr:DNA repair protein RecO [Amaricoccus sp.]MBP7241294.1 DNA repair protein RecO [Amaricoccus sp.]